MSAIKYYKSQIFKGTLHEQLKNQKNYFAINQTPRSYGYKPDRIIRYPGISSFGEYFESSAHNNM